MSEDRDRSNSRSDIQDAWMLKARHLIRSPYRIAGPSSRDNICDDLFIAARASENGGQSTTATDAVFFVVLSIPKGEKEEEKPIMGRPCARARGCV
ncbi:hypothetical protein EVAR_30934_1 [Eumeta japonica]|uniref:Uncharacterized protein n=1 Tax=Eumeta variegata TaxID=151549 RepID=A0A4C1V5Q3_EUMVA|nr:hypothetical protein EVAR_30934_1 [Eumeta japonica]